MPTKINKDSKKSQVTIIGGSELFHGAPILSLKVASRVADMVYFATPEENVGKAADSLRASLSSFIWVPWEEKEDYVAKSDAVLIGPGFMRFRSEKTPHGDRNHLCDEACRETREYTKALLTAYPHQKWVIDAGSLQVLDNEWIPVGSILTPNAKEYSYLYMGLDPAEASKKYKCTIILKGKVDIICSNGERVEITGGNEGMTKGGTGDVLAGLTVALYSQNDAFFSAKEASKIAKTAGDELYKKVGLNFNADDLANKIPEVMAKLGK
ncbi:NAD(P)H-hydrate dehydratase [Patescibacteria group bacterium]|nr:NAD(P)H-hydrate dehydratase [Patescibacteria group bacterium]